MASNKNTIAGVRSAATIQLGVSLGLVLAVGLVATVVPTQIGASGATAIAALCGLASLVALLPFCFVRHCDHTFAAAVGSMMVRTLLSGAALAVLVAGFDWPRNETAVFFLLSYLVLLVSEAWTTIGTLNRAVDSQIVHRSERAA